MARIPSSVSFASIVLALCWLTMGSSARPAHIEKQRLANELDYPRTLMIPKVDVSFETTGVRSAPSGPNPEGNFMVNAASRSSSEAPGTVSTMKKVVSPHVIVVSGELESDSIDLRAGQAVQVTDELHILNIYGDDVQV
jgi:hypothetical protein